MTGPEGLEGPKGDKGLRGQDGPHGPKGDRVIGCDCCSKYMYIYLYIYWCAPVRPRRPPRATQGLRLNLETKSLYGH